MKPNQNKNKIAEKTITAPNRLDRVEMWFASRHGLVVGLIILFSVIFRVSYFLEIYNTPIAFLHKASQMDMEFFDEWGRSIAGGDWLTDKALHPLHKWHTDIAISYYESHPEELEKYGDDVASMKVKGSPDAWRELWSKWYGGKRFHQEPLYAYLIGVIYKIFGEDPRYVFAFQMLFGVFTNVLIYLVARKFFGETVGAVSGVFAVLCAPMMFFEMTLLRESLCSFAGIALVYLSAVAMERKSVRWWLYAGVGYGVAMLLRMNFVLMMLCVTVLIFVDRDGNRRRAAGFAGALIAGVLIAMSPAIARNVAVGVGPFNMSSVGAITFVCANTEDYRQWKGWVCNQNYGAQIMSKSEGAFLSSVAGAIKTHHSVSSYADLLTGKLKALWEWYEIPNCVNFYYFRMHSMTLRLAPVTFLILGPLSLAGLALALPYARRAAPLYFLVVTTIITLLGFYVISRFRVPLMAALIPFAAFALIRMLASYKAAALGAATVVFFIGFQVMYPQKAPLLDYVDFAMPIESYYRPLLGEAWEKRDAEGMEKLYKEWMDFELPPNFNASMTSPFRVSSSVSIMTIYDSMLSDYYNILKQMGKTEEAREVKRRLDSFKKE